MQLSVNRDKSLSRKAARKIRISSCTTLSGEQLLATHKSGKTEVYQRQAGFITRHGKVLVFTLTSQRPFDDQTDQLWHAWLAGFQPV
ncbi:TPA: DcrB-related protein [Citrobacter farmeri]|nr:DcrB-related protein [Citrobacter farmeri]